MTANQRMGFKTLAQALRAAMQWRLALLWIVAMLIPTAMVTVPVWSRLSDLLDHSVHSAEWAQHFDALAMSEMYGLARDFMGVSVMSLIATLLLSPLLTGMTVTVVRAPRSPSFRELLHGGLQEYWPMTRLLLWALLPFGVAIAIGSGGFALASAYSSKAVLQSQADTAQHTAIIVLVALLMLAHATLESARAQFAADPALRSAWRALWRGAVMMLRRPFATFGLYVGVSIVGYLLVLLLAMLRVRTPAVGVPGFMAATVLTQLMTATLAWQRTARLFALTALAG